MKVVRAANHEKCVPQIRFDLHPRSPTTACLNLSIRFRFFATNRDLDNSQIWLGYFPK